MITNYKPAVLTTKDGRNRDELVEEPRPAEAVILRRLHLGFVAPATNANRPNARGQ